MRNIFIPNKKVGFSNYVTFSSLSLVQMGSFWLFFFFLKEEKEQRKLKGGQNVKMDFKYQSYLCTYNFKSKSLIWGSLPTYHYKPLRGNDLSSSDCFKLFVPNSTSIKLTLAALSTREPRNNNFQLRNQKKTWGFDLWCMTNYQIAGLMKIKLLVTTKI